MKIAGLKVLHMWKSAALAILSAILLILAFPDFGFWFLAWFALVPFLLGIEKEKESVLRSFILGWLWGFVFFTGTCWWLTFAPITYAGFPVVIAYLLLFIVTAIVGIFSGIFSAILALLLRRFGSVAHLVAPFIWVFSDFLRYWLTGNNWNSIGYSQAFAHLWGGAAVDMSSLGGIWLTSGYTVALNSSVAMLFTTLSERFGRVENNHRLRKLRWPVINLFLVMIVIPGVSELLVLSVVGEPTSRSKPETSATVVAVQPNVPMAGLTYEKWKLLRAKHVQLAESAMAAAEQNPKPSIRNPQSTTVIFPESPMNFAYQEDEEFRNFVHAFAAKNNVNVLFNSAEPDTANDKYFNSAVLVGTDGKELAQYDKIYLLPFGESVPGPLQAIVPAFVGSFSYGKEYDLLPIGDAKAGVMICFESHFGELSREYVRNGADVLIEMTNDGYLGPTPVLKQHLANAVFRAVETNSPVLRVTNVGITAYINQRGEIAESTEDYTEAARVWPVAKSNGFSQTFYVRYGDWFVWLCTIVTIGFMILGMMGNRARAKITDVSLGFVV